MLFSFIGNRGSLTICQHYTIEFDNTLPLNYTYYMYVTQLEFYSSTNTIARSYNVRWKGLSDIQTATYSIVMCHIKLPSGNANVVPWVRLAFQSATFTRFILTRQTLTTSLYQITEWMRQVNSYIKITQRPEIVSGIRNKNLHKGNEISVLRPVGLCNVRNYCI